MRVVGFSISSANQLKQATTTALVIVPSKTKELKLQSLLTNPKTLRRLLFELGISIVSFIGYKLVGGAMHRNHLLKG